MAKQKHKPEPSEATIDKPEDWFEARLHGGRPCIPILAEEVERLGQLGATQREMAAWFGCSLSALEKRLVNPKYREAYERGLAMQKLSLRRSQVLSANEGNVAMQIWLGKQLLGQRDVQEIEVGPKSESAQNLAALSTDELMEYRRLQKKIAAGSAGAVEVPASQAVVNVGKVN